MIYLDHAAGTPMVPAALAAMLPLCRENAANPSSTHAAGQAAARVLVAAREQLAALLECAPREVIFTSGGTEADNQALLTLAKSGEETGRKHLVVSAIEHPAVLRMAEWLQTQGFAVTYVRPGPDGVLCAQAFKEALRADTAGVSVMLANNEVGTLQPVAEIAALCRAHGVLCHTDAVQAAGQFPVSFGALGVDMLSLSAHKFGGAKGAGALLVRQDIQPAVLLRGGRQERGARAGTENLPAVAAMASALAASVEKQSETVPYVTALREQLIAGLERIHDARLSGHRSRRVPGIVHFCFAGAESEMLLLLLDAQGICASAGSACEAGALESSHVLRAMGMPEAWARGAVRFSIGTENTPEQIETTVRAAAYAAARLRGEV